MLIPAIGTLTASVSLLFKPYVSNSIELTYFTIGLSGILSVCLLIQTIANWKNSTLAGRFLRLASLAALTTPFSLIVTQILYVSQSNEANALSLMSTAAFGAMAFIVALNIIIVSICEYKSTKDSIRLIRDLIKANKLVFTRIAILKDVFLVVGKSIISVVSLSFFMFANTLYSMGMGVARFIAVKMHTQKIEKQIINYRRVGIIISASSVCYVLYSVRLFSGGQTGVYDINVALAIALYTFVEFGINIREAFRLRKSKALVAKALRSISFAATLLCFVLTQTAIMSFAAVGDNSFINALSGVIFGGLAACIGLYVVVDSFFHQKTQSSD